MSDKTGSAAAAENPAPENGQTPDMNITHTAFHAFIKNSLILDAKAAQTKAANSFTSYRADKILRWRRRCEANKAAETLQFYQALNDHITVFAKKESLQIQDRIAKAITASGDKGGIGEKFTAALGALKSAKEKLKIARNSGEDLVNSFKDSSFADDVSKLSKNYKDGTPSKTDNQENLHKAIEELKTESYQCFDLADDSVEIAVKVSGVNASANVKSLKAPGDKLVELVSALQADVEGNITKAAATLVKAQASYSAQMETLVVSNSAAHADVLKLGGMLGAIAQTRKPDCVAWSHDQIVQKLDDYAARIEKNFKEIAREGVPSAGTPPPVHHS